MKLKKMQKRVTSLFLALVMVISLFAGFEFKSDAAAVKIPAYTQTSEVFADANGDGIINRLDPIRTRRNATDEVTKNNKSDIDGDGTVGALDVVLSKKVAARQLTEESFYTRTIAGDTYNFIFKHVANAGDGNVNKLTWDAEENAYHYHINGDAANGYSDRNLWFDAEFINQVIAYTGATGMSFKMKTGVDATTGDIIYSNCDSTGANWFGGANQTTIIPSTTYQTIDVVFSELVTSDSGEMYMPLFCYQHGNGVSVDLYIADITFTIPEPEDNREYVWDAFTDTIAFNTTNFSYGNVAVSGINNNMSVNTTAITNGFYCMPTSTSTYFGKTFTLNTPITNVTSDMKLKLEVRASYDTSKTYDTEAWFRLYNVAYTGNANDASAYIEQKVTKPATYTLEIDMAKFVDSDGVFRGFQLANFGDYNTIYYLYSIQIMKRTPVIDWEAYTDTLTFNSTNYTVTDNTVSGLNQLMSVNTTVSTEYFYCTPSENENTYYGKKFTLNKPIKKVTDDMMLKLTLRASYDTSRTYGTEATFRMYHVDYTGSANDSTAYVEQTVTKPETYTLEIPMGLFVDSDGTFRGFQLANFGENNTIYYLYNVQIFWERPEEVWNAYSDKVYFNSTNVAYANNTVGTATTGLSGLHNSVTTTYTTDNKIYCKTAVAGSGYYGRKFTLTTPIQNVTSNMKLRMCVYVRANSSTNATTNFRLYHIDYAGDANTADSYTTVAITHGAWTEIEVDMSLFMDSDRTFRGFQFGNFDDSTVEYYFNWLEVYQEQLEEFDPVNYTLDFTEENVTVSNNDLYGLNTLYEGTFTTEDSNNVLSFANSSQYSYGGKKVTFKQAIENCDEDMLVTFRMKVVKPDNANTTTDSTSVNILLYKADAYGIHSDNVHTQLAVPVGEWTTVACTLENLLVDGIFDGFFWADFTNNYTVLFDELTVCKSDDILEYGVSAYQLLIPADSSDIIDTAAEEFNTFFEEATGTKLTVVSDNAVVEGQKYISIGETSLLAKTDITYETSELGSDGFKIVTEGDNIYAIGGSDYGSLYAVYELLAELVNYDYIYKDTYVLDKNVKNIALEEFNICEIPDIATRTASDGVVQGDPMSMYRMRVRPYSESMIWTGTDWVHTSFHFVNGVASDGTTNANVNDKWFNTNKTQLCYTAHGDSEAYEAMLDASLNTLKGAIKRFSGIRRNVVFGNQDNDDTCTCNSCAAMKSQYGADSAAAILFLQDLQAKLEAWFATDEGSRYAGEFNIIFLAYKGYEDAPTSLPSGLKYDVNCMLSTIKADYYQPITAGNATNATYYNTITQWGEITDNLYTWYYGTNFSHYLAPYDNISNMQTNYQLAVDSGATYLFDQRQHNESGFVTGWSNLKSYLSSKLMWDVNADVDALTEQFFDAYFGPAAENMQLYYDGLGTLTQTNLSSGNGFGGTKSVVQDLINSTYWPEATLEKWLGYCDAALTDIASLESSDAELYQTYKKHIEGEKLAILYLYIETYLNYSNAVEMYPYMQQVQSIVKNLGVTRYSEAGSISALLDKWGVSATDPQVVWTHGTETSGADTGFDGVNESGTVSYNNGVWKVANCYMYSGHKLAFVNPQKYDGNETVTIEIKATPSSSNMNNLNLCLYPYTYSGNMGSNDEASRGKKVTAKGEWTTITFNIAEYLDTNGYFTGFGFITDGYGSWQLGQMYTIEIKSITVN